MGNKLKEKEEINYRKNLKNSVSHSIVAIVVGIIVTVIGGLILAKIIPKPTPSTDIIVQEFEEGRIVPGGEVKNRLGARNNRTLKLRRGMVVSYRIQIPKSHLYSLIIRYSNDDAGEGDDILINFGNDFTFFHSENTREDGASPGTGWANFVETEPMHKELLEKGDLYISFVIVEDDGFGIELDRFTLRPIEKQ